MSEALQMQKDHKEKKRQLDMKKSVEKSPAKKVCERWRIKQLKKSVGIRRNGRTLYF